MKSEGRLRAPRFVVTRYPSFQGLSRRPPTPAEVPAVRWIFPEKFSHAPCQEK
jgi:hypothetical protein